MSTQKTTVPHKYIVSHLVEIRIHNHCALDTGLAKYLHHVVQLCVVTNHGVSPATTINTSICANNHVMAELHLTVQCSTSACHAHPNLQFLGFCDYFLLFVKCEPKAVL